MRLLQTGLPGCTSMAAFETSAWALHVLLYVVIVRPRLGGPAGRHAAIAVAVVAYLLADVGGYQRCIPCAQIQKRQPGEEGAYAFLLGGANLCAPAAAARRVSLDLIWHSGASRHVP
jgi:hypothetical protein